MRTEIIRLKNIKLYAYVMFFIFYIAYVGLFLKFIYIMGT